MRGRAVHGEEAVALEELEYFPSSALPLHRGPRVPRIRRTVHHPPWPLQSAERDHGEHDGRRRGIRLPAMRPAALRAAADAVAWLRRAEG